MLESSILSKLEELRSELIDLELKEEYTTNAFLYPFLKCQQMDIRRAGIMVENAVNWRKEYEGILEWDPPKGLAEIITYEFLGEDSEGRPVIYSNSGQWEIKKAIKDFGRDVYLKYFFQMLFKLEDRANKTCKNHIPSSINILNYDGFRMGQLTSSAVVSATMESTKVVNDYFPGLYDATIIVRMSRFADMFLKIFRPFFSEDFTEKLKTFGCDEAKYKPEILQYLPINQIPKGIGGLK